MKTWCSRRNCFAFFFFNDTATTEIYTLSLHDALPISAAAGEDRDRVLDAVSRRAWLGTWETAVRRAGERVTAALGGEIERAARRGRMPRRLRRRRLLTGPEERANAAPVAARGGPPEVGKASCWG